MTKCSCVSSKQVQLSEESLTVMTQSHFPQLRDLLPPRTRVLWYGKASNPMLLVASEASTTVSPGFDDAYAISRIRVNQSQRGSWFWLNPRFLYCEYPTQEYKVTFDKGTSDWFMAATCNSKEFTEAVGKAIELETVTVIAIAITGSVVSPEWSTPEGWVSERREVSWSNWTLFEAYSEIWIFVRQPAASDSSSSQGISKKLTSIIDNTMALIKQTEPIPRGETRYVVHRGKRQRVTYHLPAPCSAEKVFISRSDSEDLLEMCPHEYLPLLGYGDNKVNTHLMRPAWQVKLVSQTVPFKVFELMYRCSALAASIST